MAKFLGKPLFVVMFNDLIDTFNFMSADMKVSQIGTVGNAVIIVANIFVVIALGLSTVTLALSFIQFITSAGNPKSTEKAQKSLLWSVIGMFIAFLVFALKNLLLRSFGVSGVE